MDLNTLRRVAFFKSSVSLSSAVVSTILSKVTRYIFPYMAANRFIQSCSFYADLINRSLTKKALCSIARKILALFVGQMLKTYLKVDEVLSTVHGKR